MRDYAILMIHNPMLPDDDGGGTVGHGNGVLPNRSRRFTGNGSA
ncbi:hypothetical protein NXW09_29075 [Bacteroides ovatus]|nr:hypothetical protein [Bacteroides ovatus]